MWKMNNSCMMLLLKSEHDNSNERIYRSIRCESRDSIRTIGNGEFYFGDSNQTESHRTRKIGFYLLYARRVVCHRFKTVAGTLIYIYYTRVAPGTRARSNLSHDSVSISLGDGISVIFRRVSLRRAIFYIFYFLSLYHNRPTTTTTTFSVYYNIRTRRSVRTTRTDDPHTHRRVPRTHVLQSSLSRASV